MAEEAPVKATQVKLVLLGGGFSSKITLEVLSFPIHAYSPKPCYTTEWPFFILSQGFQDIC